MFPACQVNIDRRLFSTMRMHIHRHHDWMFVCNLYGLDHDTTKLPHCFDMNGPHLQHLFHNAYTNLQNLEEDESFLTFIYHAKLDDCTTGVMGSKSSIICKVI